MAIDGGGVRRRLTDGRVLVFELRAAPAALGRSVWRVAFESDPANAATGTPLIVVLALLLGHDPRPATWPWWLYALADDVEAAVEVETAFRRVRSPP